MEIFYWECWLTISSILFQDFVYTPKLQKKAYDEFNRSATHFSRASLMKNGGVADQTVKECITIA